MTTSQIPPGADPDAPGSGGKRRWLLIGSLMLNLLVLGALGAGLWRAGHHHHDREAGAEQGLMGYLRSMPKERREAVLGTDFESVRAGMRESRRVLDQAQRGVLDAMAAEPLDKAALESAIQQASEVEAKVRETGRALFVAASGRMTAEERQNYKRWRSSMLRPPHEGPPRRP